MTLKGHNALRYANCVVLWLNGKSYRVGGDGTIGQGVGNFL